MNKETCDLCKQYGYDFEMEFMTTQVAIEEDRTDAVWMCPRCHGLKRVPVDKDLLTK